MDIFSFIAALIITILAFVGRFVFYKKGEYHHISIACAVVGSISIMVFGISTIVLMVNFLLTHDFITVTEINS